MISDLYNSIRRPALPSGILAGCLPAQKSQQRRDWTIEQLNIQPYQHILEVGYGSGHMLQEVAHRLKVGFLAGIENSIALYQQAYRRNKRFIQQQLLQLHIGELNELTYPPHYFHSIYASDLHSFGREPHLEFMRLSNLLKSRGRLLTVIQPRPLRNEVTIRQLGERLQEDYQAAGLTDIGIEYRDMYPVTCITVIGFKA